MPLPIRVGPCLLLSGLALAGCGGQPDHPTAAATGTTPPPAATTSEPRTPQPVGTTGEPIEPPDTSTTTETRAAPTPRVARFTMRRSGSAAPEAAGTIDLELGVIRMTHRVEHAVPGDSAGYETYEQVVDGANGTASWRIVGIDLLGEDASLAEDWSRAALAGDPFLVAGVPDPRSVLQLAVAVDLHGTEVIDGVTLERWRIELDEGNPVVIAPGTLTVWAEAGTSLAYQVAFSPLALADATREELRWTYRADDAAAPPADPGGGIHDATTMARVRGPGGLPGTAVTSVPGTDVRVSWCAAVRPAPIGTWQLAGALTAAGVTRATISACDVFLSHLVGTGNREPIVDCDLVTVAPPDAPATVERETADEFTFLRVTNAACSVLAGEDAATTRRVVEDVADALAQAARDPAR